MPGCARVDSEILLSARPRLSQVLAVSSSSKLILYSAPAGAVTEYIMRALLVSVLPAGAVAQRFGHNLWVVVLHLPPNPSCLAVGASWTDVAVTPVNQLQGLVGLRPRWLVWLPDRCPQGSDTCGSTAGLWPRLVMKNAWAQNTSRRSELSRRESEDVLLL